MSDIVKDIATAFEAQVAIVLPTYAELDWKYLVDKNNYFNNALRFGVIPSGGFSASTIIKSVTVNQTFTLILTNEYVNSNDTDSQQQDSIFELYDAVNEVYVAVEGKKLGLTQVLDISLGTIDTPFFIEEQKVAVLTTDFSIQYRTAF